MKISCFWFQIGNENEGKVKSKPRLWKLFLINCFAEEDEGNCGIISLSEATPWSNQPEASKPSYKQNKNSSK